MASDEFGGAEVDELDDSVVVEQDVWVWLARVNHDRIRSKFTLGLDVAMHNTGVV